MEKSFLDEIQEFRENLGHHAGNLEAIAQRSQEKIGREGHHLTREELNSIQSTTNELARCGCAARQIESLLGEYHTMIESAVGELERFAG